MSTTTRKPIAPKSVEMPKQAAATATVDGIPELVDKLREHIATLSVPDAERIILDISSAVHFPDAPEDDDDNERIAVLEPQVNDMPLAAFAQIMLARLMTSEIKVTDVRAHILSYVAGLSPAKQDRTIEELRTTLTVMAQFVTDAKANF